MFQAEVPLYRNCHFIIIHVILPSPERINGEVTIGYYLTTAINENNLMKKYGGTNS